MFDQINRYGGGAGAGFFMNAIYFFARVSGKLLPIIRQTFMRQKYLRRNLITKLFNPCVWQIYNFIINMRYAWLIQPQCANS